MAWEDELLTVLDRLDRNMTRAFGGVDSFRGSNVRTGHSTGGGLSNTTHKIAESFRVLHGSTDQLAYSFRGLLGIGALGEAFHLLEETTTDLVSSYQKLTDVGQNFGGSMFEMARLAGESGLTLDQFTKSIERNSAVAAILSTNQTKTGNQFTDLQKGVRDNLKGFGFYGMTLTQVTDATFDYMDILRQTGALGKMSNQQEVDAVHGMITSATQFAAATGKSREEIIKLTKEIAEDPSFQNFLAQFGPTMQTAMVNSLVGIASVGGPEFAKGIASMTESLLGSADSQGLANAAIQTGFGGLFEPLRQLVLKGDSSPAHMFGAMHDIMEQFDNTNGEATLQMLELNPATAQAAKEMEASVNAMRPLAGTVDQTNASIKRANDAAKINNDSVTKAALNFESNFHQITGAFRQGFYGGIIEGMTKSGVKFDDLSDTVVSLMHAIEPLGEIVGQLVGYLLSAIKGISVVSDWISKVTGMNKGWSMLVTLLGVWTGLKLLKRMSVWTSQVIVNQAGIGVGGGGGGMFSRGVGKFADEVETHGGGFKGVIKAGAKRALGKGLVGAVLAIGFDALLSSFGPALVGEKLTGILQSSANYAGIGATIGALFGPGGMIIGAIIGAIVGPFIDHYDEVTNWLYDKVSGFWKAFVMGLDSIYHSITPDWLQHIITGPNAPTTNNPTALRSELTAPVPTDDMRGMQQRLLDLQELQKQDQAAVNSGNSTPDILRELTILTAKLVQINEAQAHLQKKTVEATKDLNQGQNVWMMPN